MTHRGNLSFTTEILGPTFSDMLRRKQSPPATDDNGSARIGLGREASRSDIRKIFFTTIEMDDLIHLVIKHNMSEATMPPEASELMFNSFSGSLSMNLEDTRVIRFRQKGKDKIESMIPKWAEVLLETTMREVLSESPAFGQRFIYTALPVNGFDKQLPRTSFEDNDSLHDGFQTDRVYCHTEKDKDKPSDENTGHQFPIESISGNPCVHMGDLFQGNPRKCTDHRGTGHPGVRTVTRGSEPGSLSPETDKKNG